MAEDILTLDQVDTFHKTVILRVDMNSPVDPETNEILDDTRIKMCVPTFHELKDARVVVLAHQSRPGKSDYTPLKSHASILDKHIEQKVEYIDELLSRRVEDRIRSLKAGEVLVLENTRFYAEEVALKNKDAEALAKTNMVKKLAHLSDIFVNDAFAAAHRAQASLIGFEPLMPMVAGRLMEAEIRALSRITEAKERPIVGILGGAKIDDSIAVAKNLLDGDKVDRIIVTGVVANAFLYASGIDIGPKNLDFTIQCAEGNRGVLDMAADILRKYGDKVMLPADVALELEGTRVETDVSDLKGPEEPIYDIGIKTIDMIEKEIKEATNLFLNGPAGYFEKKEFSLGTYAIFRAIASSKAYGVLGGGHTSAVVEALGIKDKVGHVSSGGGSFIHFLSGRKLPVIEALKRSYERYKKGGYRA